MAKFEPDEEVTLNPEEKGFVWERLLVLEWMKKGIVPTPHNVLVRKVGAPIDQWADIQTALKLVKDIPADEPVRILGLIP